LHRFLRYGGVSLIAAALAQAGLALGYGVLRWSSVEAVALSLAVSAGPSYLLSIRYVWPAGRRASSAAAFLGLAVLGSAITAATVAATEHIARGITHDHTVLAAVVNGTALVTTVAVWAARFFVLDVLMADRPPASDLANPPLSPGAMMDNPVAGRYSVPAHRMPSDGPIDVSVVLPTFNEEESVGLCVLEALDACAAAGLRAEVIVVDNNCTDNSAQIARAAGARVVTESIPGYGAAIRRGITAAQGTVVVMADADCTYPLDRVAELVRPVLAGTVDLAIGGRLESATARSMPMLHRFVGTPALSYLVRESTGITNRIDSQSGFRAFRRSTILALGLRSTGMEFASEMLIAAGRANLRVEEVAMGYRPRVGESKLNTWADGWRHVSLILTMSPYLVLWYPGLIFVGLSIALMGLSVIDFSGMNVGSLTWQPVFFTPMLLVCGILSSLAGAVLAYHSSSTTDKLRNAFSWVADPSFTKWAFRAGAGLGLVGLSMDGTLLLASLRGTSIALDERLTFGGLGQALLLSGTILMVFSLLYRMLTASSRRESSWPTAELTTSSHLDRAGTI
jgi:glycosyltransferase involved in cell wall biosynthesis